MRSIRLSAVSLSVLLICLLAAAPAALAVAPVVRTTLPVQEKEKPKQEEEQAAEEGDEEEKGDDEEEKNGKIKPYDEVITDEAETREGVFKTHRIEDKLYYEIPVSEFGGEFIWVTQIGRRARQRPSL